MTGFVVAALYQFVALPDYEALRQPLLDCCEKAGIRGTLLLAAEGINGTVAGRREAIDALRGHLAEDGRFDRLEYKESHATEMPFLRMKVRLKKEIVTMGVEGIDPNRTVGTYVPPEDWNALISDPEVTVIDTRNDYEYAIGTFERAVDPETGSFREFPAYVSENLDPGKQKKLAMFCTGGIRCEKATAYMLEQGFEEVYHLQGGILKYLETVPEEESLWKGDCFVFDERVAVGHGLKEGDYGLCRACRMPLNAVERASPLFVDGVSCPHCHDSQSDRNKARAAERQKQMELADRRSERHMGPDAMAGSPNGDKGQLE